MDQKSRKNPANPASGTEKSVGGLNFPFFGRDAREVSLSTLTPLYEISRELRFMGLPISVLGVSVPLWLVRPQWFVVLLPHWDVGVGLALIVLTGTSERAYSFLG